jgi:hypothetical protein
MSVEQVNPQESTVNLTLTLLPHQILIMPASYENKIVALDLENNNLQLLNNIMLKPVLNDVSIINLASNNKELEDNFIEQQDDSFITSNDMLVMYFDEPICGISWSLERIINFNQMKSFDLNDCKINMTITIDVQGNDSFPRSVIIEDDDDDDDNNPLYDYYADFAVLNLGSNGFQTTTIPMKFDSVDYNWFAASQSTVNEEYANALESRVEKLYRESWICQYFDYEPKCDDGIVFFYSKTKKQRTSSYRFFVNEYIPANSRPYFLPKSDWNIVSDENQGAFCRTDFLSNVTHGFKVTPCYSTKSLYYTAPFYLAFRTSPSVNSNYLMFNNFLKPNLETTILAMLLYNESDDIFIPQFLPEIVLPYLKNLSLNNVLEFKLYDSNSKLVQIDDSSQLFVTLSLMP